MHLGIVCQLRLEVFGLVQQCHFHHVAGDVHPVSLLVCHVAHCLHVAHGQVCRQIDIARSRRLIHRHFLLTVRDAVGVGHLHAVHLACLNGIGNHGLADMLLVESQHWRHQHNTDRWRISNGELAEREVHGVSVSLVF